MTKVNANDNMAIPKMDWIKKLFFLGKVSKREKLVFPSLSLNKGALYNVVSVNLNFRDLTFVGNPLLYTPYSYSMSIPLFLSSRLRNNSISCLDTRLCMDLDFACSLNTSSSAALSKEVSPPIFSSFCTGVRE